MISPRSPLPVVSIAGLAALAGCFPFFPMSRSKPAEERPPQVVTVTPVTLEELVAKYEEKKVGKIDRSLAPSPGLYHQRGGIQRVNMIDQGWVMRAGGLHLGFTELAFAGVEGDRLCFVMDENIGGTGQKKVVREMRERLEKMPMVVHVTSKLGKLKGPVWPAPAGATSFDQVELVDTDLNDEDQRWGIIKLCAPKPAFAASTRYIVVQQHSKAAEAEMTFTAEPYLYPNEAAIEKEKVDRRDDADSLFIWELVGTGEAPAVADGAPAEPEVPRPGRKPEAGEKGGDKAGDKGGDTAGGKMKLSSKTVGPGEQVKVTFDAPMTALPGERYWITIVAAKAAESAYAAYEYLPPDARGIALAAPSTAGTYEVRLHGNYPTKTTNLLLRAKLVVK